MSLASAYEDAGAQMQRAGIQAAANLNQALPQILGYLQPYTALGTGATTAYGGAMGLPGYSSAGFASQLENWPGYQFLRDQGLTGLARYGSASGLRASGAAMKGAENYSQKLASTYALQPYLENLRFGTGTGLQAGTTSANIDLQAVEKMNEYLNAAAAANAQAQVQAAQASQAQSGGFMSDILGGLGFGAGMLFGGPWGSSISSSLGGALGNMFSGWGLGGGPANAVSMAASSPATGAYVPRYAEGGYTDSRPVVVGERGPEVFVPDRPGYVVPNHELPGANLFIDFNNMFG